MAKLNLSDASGNLSNSLYNANNALIEAAMENTLSRDGTTPNVMEADIDLNSNDVNNVNRVTTTELFLNGVQVYGLNQIDNGSLGSFEDVTLSGLAEDDALMYNAVSSMWENRPLVIADISDANDTNWDAAFAWGDHSLAGYLTAETNDLSAAVTWANIPDANVPQTAVTQHEAALTILESQITDAGLLARNAGTETITGAWTFDEDITIGKDTGGDSGIEFYDDTNNVTRSIFWDDSEGAFFFEDNTGAFQQFGTGTGGGGGPDLLLMGG